MKRVFRVRRIITALLTVLMIIAQAQPVKANGAAAFAAADDMPEIRKKIFSLLYTDIKSVDLKQYGIYADTDAYTALYDCVYYTPSHLWPEVRIIRSPKNGLVLRAEFDGDAAGMRKKYNACLKAVNAMTADLKADTSLSDADKALILHDRLAVWSAYDSASASAPGSAPHDTFSPYGPLVRRKGVCNGYALAYGWLLDTLGIENQYCESKTINHAWNTVWLDGEPYYTDVAYDDPYPDTPGLVRHNNFMLSFSKFSANHKGASDFSPAPASTRYEKYFCVDSTREILYINGYIYYVNSGTKKLIRRSPAGVDTIVKNLAALWPNTVSDGYYAPYTGKILAVGDCIVYTAPKTVYSYDTVTGRDVPVYEPKKTVGGEGRCISGLRLSGGKIYVTGSTLYCDHNSKNEPSAADTESFVFCSHPGAVISEKKPGTDCVTKGDAVYKCPDCGMVYTAVGGGVYGEHDFSVETISSDTIISEASCSSPARYGYTCSVCGEVERNDRHTFTSGDALEHKWGTVVSHPPTCLSYGEWYEGCVECLLPVDSR